MKMYYASLPLWSNPKYSEMIWCYSKSLISKLFNKHKSNYSNMKQCENTLKFGLNHQLMWKCIITIFGDMNYSKNLFSRKFSELKFLSNLEISILYVIMICNICNLHTWTAVESKALDTCYMHCKVSLWSYNLLS